MTKSILFRRLAVAGALAFLAFFVWIVIIADQARGVPWWSFIGRVPHGDKVGHFCLVGTMSFLCNLAFPSRKHRIATTATLVLLALLSLEELSQAFVPSRHLDLLDWLADLAGLAAGQTSAAIFAGFVRNAVSSSETAPDA